MGTSIEAKIIDGLIDRFNNSVMLPAGTLVAYPNKTFTPDGNPYVRLTIAKNTPVPHKIGAGKEPERMGIFLATVCWPLGQGLGAASDLANAIRDAFKRTTWWDYSGIRIRIVDEPAVQGDVEDDVYSQVPVTIPWHVYP